MEIHVAFFDASEAVIVASFGCAQATDTWPHQGVVEESDARWSAYASQFPPGAISIVSD